MAGTHIFHDNTYSNFPFFSRMAFYSYRFSCITGPGERQQQEQEESEHTLKEDGSRKSVDKNTLNRDGLLKKIKKGSNFRTNQDDNKARGSVSLDIKGAITLAIAITSFLLALTFLQTEGAGNNSNNTNKILGVNYSILQVAIFFAVGIISLILFIVIERRSKSPLIDFKILLNRGILPAYIMIFIVGLSLFLVFQTIPILVRNPLPVGFGGDAIVQRMDNCPLL